MIKLSALKSAKFDLLLALATLFYFECAIRIYRKIGAETCALDSFMEVVKRLGFWLPAMALPLAGLIISICKCEWKTARTQFALGVVSLVFFRIVTKVCSHFIYGSDLNPLYWTLTAIAVLLAAFLFIGINRMKSNFHPILAAFFLLFLFDATMPFYYNLNKALWANCCTYPG